VLEPVYPGIGE
jgi:hypothetical protein